MNTSSKRKVWIYLSLGIITLIFTILLSHRNEQRVKPEKLHLYFQEKFQKKEQDLNKHIHEILNNKHIKLPELLHYCEEQKIDKDEFIFYAYQDTLLKSWSSNSISFPYFLIKTPKHSGLQRIGNTYFYYQKKEQDSLTVIGIYILKKRENREKTFLFANFLNEFTSLRGMDIHTSRDEYNVLSKEGDFLFSLVFPDEIKLCDNIVIIELILWLLSFTLLCLALYWYLLGLAFFSNRKNWICLVLGGLIALTVSLISFFKIPNSVYASNVFSSLYYASVFSSLGTLFIQSYVFLFFSIILNSTFSINTEKFKSKITQYIVRNMLIIIAIAIFVFVFIFQYSIVNDSTIIISPILLYKYNSLSILTLLSISLLFWALLISFRKIMEESLKLFATSRSFVLTIILISIVIIALVSVYYNQFDSWYFIYLSIFVLFVSVIVLHLLFPKQISIIIARIAAGVLFSLSIFFITEKINNKKIERYKEGFAELLLSAEDPLMLYDLCEIEDNIREDDQIKDFLNKPIQSSDSIRSYINTQYFENLIDKYKIDISFGLLSNPEYNKTKNKFLKRFFNSDKIVDDTNVAFLRMGMGKSMYMIKIAMPFSVYNQIDTAFVMIELESISNYVKPFIGRRPYRAERELINVTYAEYDNDTLQSYKESSTIYKLDFKKYDLDTIFSGLQFEADGYVHTVYKSPSNKVLLLSTFKDSFPKKMSLVSFLFIIILFWGFIPILLLLLVGKNKIHITFRGQIQQLVIFLLIGSSLMGAIIFINFTISSNKNEMINNTIYRVNFIENMITISLQNSGFNNKDTINKVNVDFIVELLKDYISNINVYSLDGSQLLFGKNYAVIKNTESQKINPLAIYAMKHQARSIYIETPKIRNSEHIVFYKPIRNKKGKVLAYFSYSSLARESSFDYRLTSFFSTFLSLYGLFILIAVTIGTIITRYMSISLTKISKHLAEIKLQSVNKKIEWKREDEIGLLIQEYNHLIDELEMSAELLSRSERESAWKEMAQQIAHEIKNPLTPMRLKTQLIQKEINEGSIDKDKLMKFVSVLLDQIDILTEVTSSFSSLARMHHGEGEKHNLIQIIENVIDLHANQKTYDITFTNLLETNDASVFINKTQLIRVFNNLIRNADQAKSNKKKQHIIIRLSDYGGNLWQIRIQDFGLGMDEHTLKHIFNLRFTTKSTGMGLGLVIVKNIITDWNGQIKVHSTINQGTTFTILLPKYVDS